MDRIRILYVYSTGQCINSESETNLRLLEEKSKFRGLGQ